MDARLERIAGKLAVARTSPTAQAAFGADIHGFEPGEPLSEATVVEFERRHGVVLPTSYRLFVTTIGHGGAGPGVGLTALDVDCCVRDPSGHLATPSPYLPGPRYGEDWETVFEQPWSAARMFLPGTLTVAGHGCSLVSCLVVTGPARGRVMNLDHEGPVGPYIVEDADFLAWYERWLDEATAGYDVGFFGERLPLDEPDLLAVLAGDPSPERRMRAADSLLCQPTVGDGVWDTLRRAMTADADAGVRAHVWDALRWQRHRHGERPLDDADAIADDIARYARTRTPRDLAALDVMRLLTPADILAEVEQDDPGRRRRAAYRLAEQWSFGPEERRDPRLDDAVGRLLPDPDPVTRAHAVLAVRNLGLDHRLAEVAALATTGTDPWVRENVGLCLTGRDDAPF